MRSFLSLAVLATTALSHSWNEQISLIDGQGNFLTNGYPRGYMARTDPGYNGNSMMWMLPSAESQRSRINPSDFLCHTSQRAKNQTQNYPRLQVTPGSTIAMKYLENGHVTQPLNQKAKQPSGGSVFVFGTSQPKDDAKLTDVLQWTADGSGGDKSGVLLAAQNFDDGRCHQISSAPISTQRQQQFPNPKPNQPPAASKNELWCETYVTFPKTIPQGPGAYTLYWVWDWRTVSAAQAAGLGNGQVADPGLPNGKDEFYTTCSDYDVQAQPPAPAFGSHTLQQQDPMSTAAAGYSSKVSAASIKSPAAEPSPAYASGGAPAGSAPAAPTALSSNKPTPPVATSLTSSNAMATPTPAPIATPTPQSPTSVRPAPSSVSPLRLSEFQAAAASAAPTAPSANVPSANTSPEAGAATSGAMKILTIPAGQPVYQIQGGSLVPLVGKRAEPTATATTFARLARKSAAESVGARPSVHDHAFWHARQQDTWME